MQIHDLQKNPGTRKHKTVGRGGKRGKTSGKGTKGQNARAGRKKRPEMRDVIKRLPKLRGRGKNINTSIAKPVAVINLAALSAVAEKGSQVTPAFAVAKGLVRRIGGKPPVVKILATGEIDKAVIVSDMQVSAGARTKIEKAGGKIL